MKEAIKMSDVIMSAVELVLSRGGDVATEDGDFATCGTDEIIRLDMSIAEILELPSDDVDIRDIDLILAKAKAYDSNQELIGSLTVEIENHIVETKKYEGRCKRRDSVIAKQQADIELLHKTLNDAYDLLLISGWDDSYAPDIREINRVRALAATAKG